MLRLSTLGIALIILGIMGPAYAGDQTWDQKDKEQEQSAIYTSYLRSLGFIECTVTNISDRARDVSIEIVFPDQPTVGPIGGILWPGAIWIVNSYVAPGKYARGVARVAGGKQQIRAMCTSQANPTALEVIPAEAR